MFFLLAGLSAAVGCLKVIGAESNVEGMFDGAAQVMVSILIAWGAYKIRQRSKLALQLTFAYYILDSFLTLTLGNVEMGNFIFWRFFFLLFLSHAFRKAHQSLALATAGLQPGDVPPAST